MIKKWVKSFPLIKRYFEYKVLASKLLITQHQLDLAIELIESQYMDKLKKKKNKRLKDSSCSHSHSQLPVILSLTSYSTRIDTVYLTILSLLTQTHRADRVILWLSELDFSLDILPKKLKSLQNYGLTIAFCPDIRSYKKLIPTIKLYPDNIIITFDDDVIYPENQVHRLLETYKNNKNSVVCHRAHKLLKNNRGELRPYKQWEFDVREKKPAFDIVPIGIGGVLYPPGCFWQEVINEAAFMKLCPDADDLWFKAMTLKNGYMSKVVDEPVEYRDYLQIPSTRNNSLWQSNVTNNDRQLKAILTAYPELIF